MTSFVTQRKFSCQMLNFVPDAKGYIDVGRAMWSKIYIIQVNVVRFYVLDDVEQQNNLYHGDTHCHLI